MVVEGLEFELCMPKKHYYTKEDKQGNNAPVEPCTTRMEAYPWSDGQQWPKEGGDKGGACACTLQ